MSEPTPVDRDAQATAQQLQQRANVDRAATQESRSWQSNRDDVHH